MMPYVVTILFVLSSVTGLYAHGGRTDSSGGHRNRKTGGYHYHSSGTPSPQYRAVPRRSYQTSARTSYRKTSRTHAVVKKKKPAKPIQKKTGNEAKLKYEMALTQKSGSRVLFKVRILKVASTLPSESQLLAVAKLLNPRRSYLVHFYLPGMNIKSSAWAVAVKTSSKPLAVRTFDKRLPARYTALIAEAD